MTAEHGQGAPGATAPEAGAPLLTIVVPAYQEEALLAQNVRRLVETLRGTDVPSRSWS